MFNMPIYNIWITAVIFVGIGLVSLILWLIFRKRYVTSMEYDRENNKSVTLQVPDKEDKTKMTTKTLTKKSPKTIRLQWVLRVINALMGVAYVVAIFLIITYSWAYSTAKKYGAYDAFERVETLNTVMDLKNVSYIDQSNDVPDGDARLGCILIFYRYNCSDCRNTHDMILETIAKYPNSTVYFVSTRTEKGKALVAEYNIQEVPSAIYIRKPDNEHDVASFGPYTIFPIYESDYDFFEKKPNGDAVVDSEGNNVYTTERLDTILRLQQETEDIIANQNQKIEDAGSIQMNGIPPINEESTTPTEPTTTGGE